MLTELYLHGLSLGDFESALKGLLGDEAPLSVASTRRLGWRWPLPSGTQSSRSCPKRRSNASGITRSSTCSTICPHASQGAPLEPCWPRCLHPRRVGRPGPGPNASPPPTKSALRLRWPPSNATGSSLYDFPEAQLKHMRTTNPVESLFASVRLRTDAGKRYNRGKRHRPHLAGVDCRPTTLSKTQRGRTATGRPSRSEVPGRTTCQSGSNIQGQQNEGGRLSSFTHFLTRPPLHI